MVKTPEVTTTFPDGRKSVINDDLKLPEVNDGAERRYMFSGGKYTPSAEAAQTTKPKNSWLDENLKMTHGETDFTFIGAHKQKNIDLF